MIIDDDRRSLAKDTSLSLLDRNEKLDGYRVLGRKRRQPVRRSSRTASSKPFRLLARLRSVVSA